MSNLPYICPLTHLPVSKDKQLQCPWPGCQSTAKSERLQDLNRHMLSAHLPHCLFCPISSCDWRGVHKDNFKKHLKSAHPAEDCEPRLIYDTKLVLGYIEEGAPVQRVQKYALDFVAERAIELGKTSQWGDLCGRRAKAGWCNCP
jgi:hypothetical protein